MQRMRTSIRPRVHLCGLVLAVGLGVSGLGSASAETAAECRYLAARLGVAAACGGAQPQDPTGGTAPLPPETPSEAAPPPPPPPSGRISAFRQTWPQSAPWGTDWSNYFDAGKEGWGTFFWTIRRPGSDFITVIGASTTD